MANAMSENIMISLLEHELLGAWLLGRHEAAPRVNRLECASECLVNLLSVENTGTCILSYSITKVINETTNKSILLTFLTGCRAI
jgi:hypothetical protein